MFRFGIVFTMLGIFIYEFPHFFVGQNRNKGINKCILTVVIERVRWSNFDLTDTFSVNDNSRLIKLERIYKIRIFSYWKAHREIKTCTFFDRQKGNFGIFYLSAILYLDAK